MLDLFNPSPISRFHNGIRPIDLRRDLGSVANLIEQCFADTLDADGRQYVENLRRSARQNQLLSWMEPTLPVNKFEVPSGFVWEQSGQVIGNLSLIPFITARGMDYHRKYLIANVAVHPSHRQQGIARVLTQAALDCLNRVGAEPPWLHVRQENTIAHHLYLSLGFKERMRRSTWRLSPPLMLTTSRSNETKGLSIRDRNNVDWKQQKEWFRKTYPTEIDWYYGLPLNGLRPGFFGMIFRFFNDFHLRQWSVILQKELLAVLVWQPTHTFADALWLSAAPDSEEIVLPPMLNYLRSCSSFQRPLMLEYPLGRAVDAFQKNNFVVHQNLIWMQFAK